MIIRDEKMFQNLHSGNSSIVENRFDMRSRLFRMVGGYPAYVLKYLVAPVNKTL